MMIQRRATLGTTLRYGAALALVAVSVALTRAAWEWIEPTVAFVYAAVVLSALYGGLGPGVFASLLAAPSIEHFLFEPIGDLDYRRGAVRLGALLLTALIVGFLCGARRRAQAQIERRVVERTRQLATANARLRDHDLLVRTLLTDLAVSEQRQRRRLASELHAGACQTLAALSVKLGLVRLDLGSAAPQRVEDCLDLAREAIDQVRSLTSRLGAPDVEDLGLEAGVLRLAAHVRDRHGTPVDCDSEGSAEPLDEEVRVVLLEGVRELLMNVVKHARATSVGVRIRWRPDQVEVFVHDDGVGFQPDVPPRDGAYGGFGLGDARERLEGVGGSLRIESEPGGGTRAHLRAPTRALVRA